MGPAIAASRSVGLPYGFAEFGLSTAHGRPGWLKGVGKYLLHSGALFACLFDGNRQYPTLRLTDACLHRGLAPLRAGVGRGPGVTRGGREPATRRPSRSRTVSHSGAITEYMAESRSRPFLAGRPGRGPAAQHALEGGAQSLDGPAAPQVAGVGLQVRPRHPQPVEGMAHQQQLGLGVDARALRRRAEPGKADLDGPQLVAAGPVAAAPSTRCSPPPGRRPAALARTGPGPGPSGPNCAAR